MNPIDLLLELAERLGIIATVGLLMTKSLVFRKYLSSQITQRERLTLIIVFGVFSMAGTYSGVSIHGAMANTSAIGTVSAGLLGGPLVGLGVGTITGLHLYIFYGGFTGLACAVSPIIQGLLGGLVYWLAREKACDWKVGIGLGVIAQILEMIIILMLARPFVEAWNFIRVIAMPMMIFNGLGVGLFLLIVKTVYPEEEQIAAIQAQNVLQIADMTLPYFREGNALSLSELYAKIPKNHKAEIQGSVRVQTLTGLSLKIVFVQNRNNHRDWLAILTTDLALDNAEIIRIYGMRWGIETFFKVAKSHLKLGTEFQGRSFDMMISHTIIVFTRYLILEWERRQNNDERSLGGLFYLFADEVMDLDLKTALRQLMAFVLDLLPNKPKNKESLSQLHNWISELPSYIKALFAQLRCES